MKQAPRGSNGLTKKFYFFPNLDMSCLNENDATSLDVTTVAGTPEMVSSKLKFHEDLASSELEFHENLASSGLELHEDWYGARNG